MILNLALETSTQKKKIILRRLAVASSKGAWLGFLGHLCNQVPWAVFANLQGPRDFFGTGLTSHLKAGG